MQGKVIGKPDVLFPGKRLAVFVDGCFWHGCPAHKNIPATNHDFWMAKISKNQERDAVVNQEVTALGWTVLLVYGPVSEAITQATAILIIIGGCLYSVGVIFHLWERLPFQNAIWHLFVLIATFVFYSALVVEISIGT